MTATSCSAAGESRSHRSAASDSQILFIGDEIALADTQYGKVKGYVLRGINYFLGIPYGADTSGPNRFMPPQKAETMEQMYFLQYGGVIQLLR